jgi:DNA processing protein
LKKCQKMSIEERAYWLAWSQISGVGPVLLKRLQQHFGILSEAWIAPAKAIAEVDGFGPRLVDAVGEARSRLNPQQLFEQHLQNNSHFWTPADPDYPRLLLEIPSPPPVLYYRGKVDLLENQGITPLIGIVGTRFPTNHGRRWTHNISTALAQHGFTVVSGMAAGIDGEAHRACLEAGGRTLAVLGTGVDIIYPSSHQKLYEQIQQQGLVLSEYPAGTKPERGNFPPRNRIIAGLARAVLVMEAPEKSGSLITAKYATEFDRDVYSLPNSPDVEQAKGCLRLIHRGAEMIVEEEELLEVLGAIPKLDLGKQQLPMESTERATVPDLTPELQKLLDAIASEPTLFDSIVQKTGFAAGQVSGWLLQLELLGLISQLPGLRYQKP